MSVVVQFKPKGHVPSEATRAAIEAEFMRMAERHGCYEVVTVATYLVAVAIETAAAKHRPITDGWVADLKARLKRALKKA